MTALEVRVGSSGDHRWVVDTARQVLGDPYQVHSRRQFHVLDAELLIAERGAKPVGFLAWEVDGGYCEVLAIACIERRAGVGTALVNAVRQAAVQCGCGQLRVVTTDANVTAQRFYEHVGFALAERLVGAVDECRRLYKCMISAEMHDELRYERALQVSGCDTGACS